MPLALLTAAAWPSVAAADGTVSYEANVWDGAGDWFSNGNWSLGEAFIDVPRTDLGTYFHVSEIVVNGIPTNTYVLPDGPAVLASDFTSTSTLTMAIWDGPSAITIESGATLRFTSATVGAPLNHNGNAANYVPTGPIQPATIDLSGAIGGSWTFTQDSVLNLYAGATILDTINVQATVNNHTAYTPDLTRWSGIVHGWNNVEASSTLTIGPGVFELTG